MRSTSAGMHLYVVVIESSSRRAGHDQGTTVVTIVLCYNVHLLVRPPRPARTVLYEPLTVQYSYRSYITVRCSTVLVLHELIITSFLLSQTL